MPNDNANDHDVRAVSTHDAGALARLHAQIEAREQAHALATHLVDALRGPDDIDDVPWNREEMP